MLPLRIDFCTLGQLFQQQAQALFTLLVLTAAFGEDLAQLRLAAVVVEADELVGPQPGAQLGEEFLAIG
ncbi:hypothetical protein D3C84_383480 [compost metagenome]